MPTKETLAAWGYGDPDSPTYRTDHVVTFSEAGITLNVHRGLVPCFRYLVRRLHRSGVNFARVHDDWSYLNKGIEGYPPIYKSWHSVGGAIDLNATQNVMGNPTTSFPIERTRRIVTRCGLTWGYEWQTTRPDPMHFEVAFPLSQMVHIAKGLRVIMETQSGK
jgi:hypothetical protein